jgi:hypothetical protein
VQFRRKITTIGVCTMFLEEKEGTYTICPEDKKASMDWGLTLWLGALEPLECWPARDTLFFKLLLRHGSASSSNPLGGGLRTIIRI